MYFSFPGADKLIAGTVTLTLTIHNTTYFYSFKFFISDYLIRQLLSPDKL